MTDSPKIAILTPSRDGRAHLDHSEAVAAVRLEAYRRGLSVERLVGKGSSNLPRNRNMLAAQALKNGADILFWIDCDIAFNPQDFFRFIEQDVDILAGVPQARSHAWGENPRLAGVNIQTEPDETGFHRCEAAPTAFMAVKAEVYYALRDKGIAINFTCPAAPEELWPHLHNWHFYQIRPRDEDPSQLMDDAEDYYFCRKWRQMGGKIHVAPDARLHHFEGLVRHSLCLQDVIDAQNKTIVEGTESLQGSDAKRRKSNGVQAEHGPVEEAATTA